tara:strand:- start:412 stop:2277 length:1866 start_codon:yes stop_codon:yes gene_type:complete
MAKPSIVIGDGKFATKDTKFLGYVQGDSSSRFVARELDFSRGSNISATRFLPSGLLEKGREQLLINTVFAGLTRNGRPTGYNSSALLGSGSLSPLDSDSTKVKFEVTNASGGRFYVNETINITGHALCTSVFVDEVTGTAPEIRQIVRSFASGGTNRTIIIAAMKDGEIVSDTDTVEAGHRYSTVCSFDGNSVHRFGLGTNQSFDAVGSITLSKPQVEVGVFPTSYIENTSTSATAKVGILEDEARIDYSDNSNGYLLLEPTRQNLITFSEYFGGSAWDDNSSGVTVVNNHAVSPEGIKNATKLIINSGVSSGAEFRTATPVSVTSGEVYAFSIFAKADGFDQVQLDVFDSKFGSTNTHATFSGDGSITSSGADTTASSIENYGNGWYRIILVGTCIASGTCDFILRLQVSGINDTGDGSKGILIYGAQVEEGAFATSYIPTYGIAATRASEGLPALSGSVIDMSGFMKGDDVTLVAHWADNPQQTRDNSTGGIRLSNGDSQNGSVRIYRNNDNDRYMSVVFFGTSADSFGSGARSASTMLSTATPKVAVRRVRSTGVFTVYLNGSPLDVGLTDANGDFTNSNFDVTWDDLQISGGSQQKYLLIKLFDSALTNSEMASETS